MPMVSASMRFRNVVIGGSSSRSEPSASVSCRPVAVLERGKRAAFDLAGVEQRVELPQRIARVARFEIVVGAEQALPAGLALALGDRAERVEPPRDGREEALLALDVGRDRTEQRRLRLVGAVRAPEPLNGGVRLPAGLQHVVDAQALILRAEIGVIGAAGAARVGEDEDALLVILKRLRLGEVRGAGAVLDGEAVDAVAARPCARCGASAR